MGGMQWILDLAVAALLTATLYHALRLERALGVLKRDRSALEALVVAFNSSTNEAQEGITRLRAAADGAGRQIARQTEAATALKEDLGFLIGRGERVADRMDQLVRAARALADEPPRAMEMAVALPPPTHPARVRSKAERDLLAALGGGQ